MLGDFGRRCISPRTTAFLRVQSGAKAVAMFQIICWFELGRPPKDVAKNHIHPSFARGHPVDGEGSQRLWVAVD
eukprot:1783087-Heterocapsa_arctica.AAC.1